MYRLKQFYPRVGIVHKKYISWEIIMVVKFVERISSRTTGVLKCKWWLFCPLRLLSIHVLHWDTSIRLKSISYLIPNVSCDVIRELICWNVQISAALFGSSGLLPALADYSLCRSSGRTNRVTSLWYKLSSTENKMIDFFGVLGLAGFRLRVCGPSVSRQGQTTRHWTWPTVA